MPLQTKSQRSYAVVIKITTALLFLQRNGLKPAFSQKLTFEVKMMTFLYQNNRHQILNTLGLSEN